MLMMKLLLANMPLLHAPSPLVGEGWGEGVQTISLRYKCEVRSFFPIPNPLPQGARGLDCGNVQLFGSY
jgi:hypothetical protein